MHCWVFHPFLFLSLITKPNPNYVLFKVQLFCDGSDFFRGWTWLDGKIRLQRSFLRCCYRGAFSLPLVSIEKFRLAILLSICRFCFFQPSLKDGLESNHVIMRQSERLEPADGALTEGADPRYLEVGEGGPNVSLSDPKLDPSLFKPFSEGFQLSRIRFHIVDARHPTMRGQRVRVTHTHCLVKVTHGL